jgi:ubiquinone/menaquinone biosynthesis C-methylase UbiE
MDQEDIRKNSAELMHMLIQGTVALTTIQGVELGFFDWIPLDKAVTPQVLSGQMGFDISKVERWLRFAEANGYVTHSAAGYTLTAKGTLIRQGTPTPDLLGLHHMFSYFTKAVQYSREAYQKCVGLDSITQGKISRDYIPKVASQLSRTAAEFFKWSGLSTGHTILDLGCGDGSVLRETIKVCPGISAKGLDLNVHTLELGKKKNTDAGLQDQIDLQVGDVTALTRIKDGAVDWVYAINVFHFLPVNKREPLIREMIRISRYGVFFNQVIAKNIQTLATDVLCATLFSDYTGFFTGTEADEMISHIGNKHIAFLPIIQGESRLVVLYTSKNDMPLNRIGAVPEASLATLSSAGIHTAKDLLSTSGETLTRLGIDGTVLRKAAIKTLFP